MAKRKQCLFLWWKKLLAEGETNTVSHKRLVSIISLVMLIILSILSAFGHSATIEYIYIFGILTGGESFLTTIEKTTDRIRRTKHNIRKKINEEPIEEDEVLDA